MSETFANGIEKKMYTGELDFSSFKKSFQKLCEKKHLSEAWRMFVYMTAWEIADHCGNQNQHLYNEYWNYYKQLNEVEHKALLELMGIAQLQFSKDPYHDWLGEMYMAEGLADKKNKSQFFTPRDLSRLAAKLSMGTKEDIQKEIDKKGYISLSDDCIGAGSMPLAALEELDRMGFDPKTDVRLWGRDNSEMVLLQAYIQLSLAGAAGYLILGDTLTLKNEYALWTPQMLSDVWQARIAWENLELLLESSPRREEAATE